MRIVSKVLTVFVLLGAVAAFAPSFVPTMEHATAVAQNPSDKRWVCSKCGKGPFKCHPNFLPSHQNCPKGGYHTWKEVR